MESRELSQQPYCWPQGLWRAGVGASRNQIGGTTRAMDQSRGTAAFRYESYFHLHEELHLLDVSELQTHDRGDEDRKPVPSSSAHHRKVEGNFMSSGECWTFFFFFFFARFVCNSK